MTDVSPKPRHDERKSDTQEEDLVRAAQSGDRSASGALYERYARMVQASCSAASRQEQSKILCRTFL